MPRPCHALSLHQTIRWYFMERAFLSRHTVLHRIISCSHALFGKPGRALQSMMQPDMSRCTSTFQTPAGSYLCVWIRS